MEVAEGLAVTDAPLEADSPEEGLHIYVLAPLALSTTDVPLQITGVAGFINTTGKGLTVIATLAVLEHPLASVPVTV